VLKVLERHSLGHDRWFDSKGIWRHCKEHGVDRAESTVLQHLLALERKKWIHSIKKKGKKTLYQLVDPRYYNTCSDCEQEFRSMELDYLCEQCRNR